MHRVLLLSLALFLIHFQSYSQQSSEPQSKPLLCAYYFDGWAGSSLEKGEWAKNAPSGLTYKLFTEYAEREPLWGWRDDDIKIMERQIDLASKNGIDAFVFCWYWPNNKGSFDKEKADKHRLHNSLRLFLKAKNKHKMKFAVLIANHENSEIIGEENWGVLVRYLNEAYFQDEQYLRIDDKPFFSVFQGGAADAYIPFMRQVAMNDCGLKGLTIASCNYHVVNNNFDITSFYNETVESSKAYKELDYSTLVEKTDYYNSMNPSDIWLAPSCVVGWDKRPWFDNEDFLIYVNRKPKLFYEMLCHNVDYVKSRGYQHPMIMIYAWNELGEGGYLVPTKGDRRASYLKSVKKAKKYINKKFK